MAHKPSAPATTWYLRSAGDADTHLGALRQDGTVLSNCGVTFRPRPLLYGALSLPGDPPDRAQACPQCRDGKPAQRNRDSSRRDKRR
ncbi:MAG: hypothetical protein ACRDSH_16615 [Pseudonocardiaceae bacterium]